MIAQEVCGTRATSSSIRACAPASMVARALALGAHAAFSGKAFLWSLGALGQKGPPHFINMLREEPARSHGTIGMLHGFRPSPCRAPGMTRMARTRTTWSKPIFSMAGRDPVRDRPVSG